MNRCSSRWRARALALLSVIALGTVGFGLAADSAGAAATCTISEYPALAAGQSGVKTACTIPAPAPTTLVFHDYAPSSGTNAGAVWHSGAARVTAADGHTTSGSPNISSATGLFATRDINHSISGVGIPPGTYIKSVTGATTAVMSANATATATTRVFTIENSTSRVFVGHTTSGSGTVTSTTANFQANDVGKYISGQGMKPGTKITARASTSSVTVSPVADATSPSAGVQLTVESTVEASTSRQVSDAHTTSGSATVTSASALFSATDVGINVTGPGIPANTIINSVSNATTVVLNHTATATSTTAKLVIGKATATAPATGSQVLQIGAELQLNPTLVATSDSCAENTPEGFSIDGKWMNPGAFVTTGVLGAPVSGAIAQVLVPTAVVSFAGYVVPKAGNNYDVNFPLVPTGLASCTGKSIGSTFTFDAVTLNQGSLPSNTGTPGTNQVRALRNFPAATASQATTAQVVLGSTTISGGCTVSRQLGNPTFACGTG